ncbi:methyl-accepting chemotaxis protein [Methylobacterium sp. WL120]|uniref:methyl-accepting chemotaxis protein n=1 Tax=Methylobacterium sp. WL120 TaxID=2603887 RepID=UPI001FEEC586|nr:methyl-accepting chemotaxis protein [Methylobacterium sp. WL120]
MTESPHAVDFEAVLGALPTNVLVLNPTTAAITYANKRSVETLNALRQHLPSVVDPNRMVGQSMDVFHKNPHHQRSIVGDPSRLPWRTKIKLGPKTLDLHVSAVHAANGEYIAAVLSWADVSPLTDGIASFDRTMQAALNQTAAATGAMRQAADSVLNATGQTSESAGRAASSAAETTVNVQSLAAAVEEFSASNAEITRQMTHSSSVTAQAVTEAQQAMENVSTLSETSQRIGVVVGLINSIANQTNLLALNATIEAARAGPAGRGFSVVAAEVKELAAQTAKATSDISDQINMIQSATRMTVSSIERISEVIKGIDAGSTTVAAAAEEQAAASAEISRSARDAADLTTEVSGGISAVAASAATSTDSAQTVLHATTDMDNQMAEVTRAVATFLEEVRRI